VYSLSPYKISHVNLIIHHSLLSKLSYGHNAVLHSTEKKSTLTKIIHFLKTHYHTRF